VFSILIKKIKMFHHGIKTEDGGPVEKQTQKPRRKISVVIVRNI